eukprot:UN21991
MRKFSISSHYIALQNHVKLANAYLLIYNCDLKT